MLGTGGGGAFGRAEVVVGREAVEEGRLDDDVGGWARGGRG